MKKDTKDREAPGRLLAILATAVAVVAALSLVPWSRITNSFFKDYNLLEDISDVKTDKGDADETVDPALLAAQKEAEAEMKAMEDAVAAGAEIPDSLLRPVQPSRRGNLVVLEDYSLSGDGLARFRTALTQRAKRPVRVAVIGDSYIEGDIYSRDIREKLQSLYGGRGVGYVTPHNIVSGFRPSVRQSDSGWEDFDLRKDNSENCRWLSGQRFTGGPGATVTWRAADSPEHVKGWNTAKILFKSNGSGVLVTDMGTGPQEHQVSPSKEVQCISLSGEMTRLSLTNKSVGGLTVLGIWLNDGMGVTVDNMSLRGNSGITHRNVSPELARDMARFVDYDLIIVEYGLNALTSKQKDYSYYAGMMAKVLATLKESYPNADIIMMGAGDRGQKSGAEVHSTPTLPYMVDAQRKTARRAGVMFWDTREAMGGEDAIVRWRNDKLVNADYIHMNFQGGEKMAGLFVSTLRDALGTAKRAPTPSDTDKEHKK